MRKQFLKSWLAAATATSLVILCGIAAAQRPSDDEEKSAAKAVLWQSGDITTIEATVSGRIAAGTSATVEIYEREAGRSKRILNNDDVPDCEKAAMADIC